MNARKIKGRPWPARWAVAVALHLGLFTCAPLQAQKPAEPSATGGEQRLSVSRLQHLQRSETVIFHDRCYPMVVQDLPLIFEYPVAQDFA